MAINYTKDGVEYSTSGNAAPPPGATNIVNSGTGGYIGGKPNDSAQPITYSNGQYSVGGKSYGIDNGATPKANPTAITPTTPQANPATAIQPEAQNPATSTLPTMDQANAQFMKDNPQYGYNGQANPSVMTPEMTSQLEKNKFRQSFEAIKAAGTPMTDNAGDASAVVQKATSAINQDNTKPSVVGPIMETDSNFDSILTNYDKFFSPTQQKTSLLQEYQSMSKNLGLDTKNAELIDAKKVIDGTEDDIRLEVEKAGGFATDSQVQALANSRNKSLIKNYNYLLESRDSAMTQLNTMMNLTIQDRQMATAEFDRKLNFAFKVQDYKDKALNNAREAFNNIAKTVGYDGLLASLGGNSGAISRVESTLGLGQGGLNALASGSIAKREVAAPTIKSINGQDMQWNPKTGKWDQPAVAGGAMGGAKATPNLINPSTGAVDPRSQLSQIIKNSGAKTDDKLKLTGSVVSVLQDFADANKGGTFEGLGAGQIIPGLFLGQKGQSNRTALSALEGTVESWMTGASVSDDQQKRIKSQLVPKAGDSDKQVKNKVNALANYMMSFTAGQLATQGIDFKPQPIDFFAPVVVPGPDGKEYEIVN